MDTHGGIQPGSFHDHERFALYSDKKSSTGKMSSRSGTEPGAAGGRRVTACSAGRAWGTRAAAGAFAEGSREFGKVLEGNQGRAAGKSMPLG